MDVITRVPNGGLQCRLRATIENVAADSKLFAPGETCLCEQDFSLWKVSLDRVWKEM